VTVRPRAHEPATAEAAAVKETVKRAGILLSLDEADVDRAVAAIGDAVTSAPRA
jgi:hypothetical protein